MADGSGYDDATDLEEEPATALTHGKTSGEDEEDIVKSFYEN